MLVLGATTYDIHRSIKNNSKPPTEQEMQELNDYIKSLRPPSWFCFCQFKAFFSCFIKGFPVCHVFVFASSNTPFFFEDEAGLAFVAVAV